MNPKRINPQPRRSPTVRLDPRYYGHYRDLEARFPFGAPSLVRCLSLEVEGDVRFGRDVVIAGNVRIRNPKSSPMPIPDGTVLDDTNV
jgi:UTP--glucose-1-phosphate uridylyltransferase